jgi:hypothetical protein
MDLQSLYSFIPLLLYMGGNPQSGAAVYERGGSAEGMLGDELTQWLSPRRLPAHVEVK